MADPPRRVLAAAARGRARPRGGARAGSGAPMRALHVCEDHSELAQRAAKHIAHAAERAVEERGRFTLCLSGGETPVETYALLGATPSSVPWQQVHVFWGDERCLPLDRPDNHFTL